MTAFTSIADGSWYFVHLQRKGNTVQPYVNSFPGTKTDVTGITFPAPVSDTWIGQYNNVAVAGYIDEVRISKGIARTTGNCRTTAFTSDSAYGTDNDGSDVMQLKAVADAGGVMRMENVYLYRNVYTNERVGMALYAGLTQY